MSKSTDAMWLGIAGTAVVAVFAVLFYNQQPSTAANVSVGISSQTPQQPLNDMPKAKTETKAQVTVTPDQTTLGIQMGQEYVLPNGSKKLGETVDTLKSFAKTVEGSLKN
jgi:hypothetical protein